MTVIRRDTGPDSVGALVPPARDGKVLLNLGCGSDCHSAFVNIDLVPGPGVIGYDLRRGIPFPHATYDLVYHSTMLSHLRPPDALNLMRECWRVLKPGGVLRVVTEDLEQMCRVYLQKLEAAWSGDSQGAHDHAWMILEIYDQATRESPGGRIASYLRQDPLPNEAFIYSRIGEPGRNMVSRARSALNSDGTQTGSRGAARHNLPWRLLARARKAVVTALLGPGAMEAFEIGTFRLSSGQISYRMYDRYSLRELFLAAGFSNVALRKERQSGYALWDSVNLDVAPNGESARPHALIMEGIRPSEPTEA